MTAKRTMASSTTTGRRHRVPVVITSLGARPEVNRAVHGYGGVVLHDVIDDRFARKAIGTGADGLIARRSGADPCSRMVRNRAPGSPARAVVRKQA